MCKYVPSVEYLITASKRFEYNFFRGLSGIRKYADPFTVCTFDCLRDFNENHHLCPPVYTQ